MGSGWSQGAYRSSISFTSNPKLWGFFFGLVVIPFGIGVLIIVICKLLGPGVCVHGQHNSTGHNH